MTGREKIEAAFSTAGTPEFGAVICYEGIYFRDHWARLTTQPFWALQSGEMERHLAVHRDLIRNVGQDWYHLPLGPTRRDRVNVRIEERPEGVFRIDGATGAEKRLEPRPVSGWEGHESYSPHPDKSAATTEEIDAIFPAPAPGSHDAVFENGAMDLTEALLATDMAGVFPMGGTSSPLWSGCYGVWSFDEMMGNYIERPELIHHACARRLAGLLPGIEAQGRLGCGGCWIEECMTDMISPRAFREFNLPYLKQLIGAIREAGMFSVYYYCGDPSDRLELLLEAGADALSLEESKKGWAVDIDRVVDFVAGRAVVLGNLDAIGLLASGSESALRAEIARQVAAGRRNGSRFIMSIGSPVTPGTPVERVRLYCDLVHEIGS